MAALMAAVLGELAGIEGGNTMVPTVRAESQETSPEKVSSRRKLEQTSSDGMKNRRKLGFNQKL